MDKKDYVGRRKARYMAQTMEAFEAKILPHLPKTPEVDAAVKDFKGLTRARFNALAADSIDIMSLSDTAQQNGLATEIRDRISPVGRP